MPGRELNLLSLDGGGVRGLSSLYILQRIMDAIDPENPPKPCDCFDLIGGTSTGGLIAIMLGRLEMSVDECIKAYTDLSREVFHKKRRSPVGIKGDLKERYDSEALELAVRKVIRDRNLDENALLKNPHGTKVFVCCTSGETSQTTLLRSWHTTRGDPDLYKTVRIWEAARATSAASSFFDSISIGEPKQRFLDGGTGANNPVHHVWGEAVDCLPHRESLPDNLGCLISIGTGQPGYRPFEETVVGIGKALLNIATGTESIANQFQREKSELFENKTCFRFNVPRGLGDIGLAETEQLAAIKSMTADHLQTEAVQAEIRSCVQRLGERQIHKSPTRSSGMILQRLERVTQDEDHDFYTLSQDTHWQLSNSEDDSRDLLDRISNYQPQRVHCKITMQKTKGTTHWIVEDILSWASNYAHGNQGHEKCLWLSGIVGCGKTFLASTAIETLLEKNEPVAHFYFDPNKHDTLTTEYLLRSYIKQFLRHLYKTQKKLPVQVSVAIKRMFGAALNCFSILLQETPVKIIICGRDELDVARRFPGSVHLEVTRAKAIGDVALFVKQSIEKRNTYDGPISNDTSTIARIRDTLIDQAGEMFLWARLQIDVLWDTCTTDAQINLALSNLPKDLDETYERCLQRVQEKGQQYSLRVLRYVYEAKSPLTIDALSEALATDPETGKLDHKQKPAHTAILRSGANLIVYDEVERMVTPAHHSVRRFLDSSKAEVLKSLKLSIWYDAELNLGEMCIVHLLWHTSAPTAEHFRNSADNAQTTQLHLPAISQMSNWIKPINQKMTRLMDSWLIKRKEAAPSTKARRQTPVVLTLPARQKSLKSYGPFHSYARNNWISLSRGLTTTSTTWPQFEGLVRVDLMDSPNESKRGDSQMFPWKSDTSEPLSSKILGWAICNEHLPLLELGMIWQQDLTTPLDDYEGLRPLCLAAKRGCIDVFKQMQNNKSAWPEATCTKSARTALHYAAEQGNSEIVGLLLELNKARNTKAVMFRDHEDRTPFELAIQSGSLATIEVIDSRCESSVWSRTNNILLTLTIGKAPPGVVKYVVGKLENNLHALRDAAILAWVINNNALSLVPSLVNAGVSLDVALDSILIHRADQVDQDMWQTKRPALFFALEAPTPELAIAFVANGASSDVYHRFGRLRIHPIDLALSRGWISLASDLCPRVSSSHGLQQKLEVTVQVASESVRWLSVLAMDWVITDVTCDTHAACRFGSQVAGDTRQRFFYAKYQTSSHTLKISLRGPKSRQPCLKLKFMMEGRGTARAKTTDDVEFAKPVVVGAMGQKLGLDFNKNPFNIQCLCVAGSISSSTDLTGLFEWTNPHQDHVYWNGSDQSDQSTDSSDYSEWY
ncbi:ankyrin, partial [Aureobasidium melanogenum]